jgi:uncharacterized protein (TIGR03067 family)
LLLIVAFQPDAAEKARESLVGTWTGFAVEGKGEKPNQGPVKLELIITKDLIKAKQVKGKDILDLGEGSFALDLGKAPNLLDASKNTGNPNRKENWVGIYKLDGDTLQWCVARKERPKDFATGQGAFLIILKRQPK